MATNGENPPGTREPSSSSTSDGDGGSDSGGGDDSLSISVGDGSDGNSGTSGRTTGSGGGTRRASRGSGGRSGGRDGDVQSPRSRKRERKATAETGARTSTARLEVASRRTTGKGRRKAEIPAQALGQLAGVAFGLAAARRGPHWALQPTEQQSLSEALAGVLRHVPVPEKELGIATDLATLGLVSYVILAPRLELDKTAKPSQPKQQTAPPATPENLEELFDVVAAHGPTDLSKLTPDQIEKLNEYASGAGVTAGIDVSGTALGGTPIRSVFGDGADVADQRIA